MCPHNMVLSFLAPGFHLSKADLPDIKESALMVLSPQMVLLVT